MGKWRPMAERAPRWSVAGRMRTQSSCLSSSAGVRLRGCGGAGGGGMRNPSRKLRKADCQGSKLSG